MNDEQPQTAPRAYLESLAAALDPGQYTAVLLGDGEMPCLRVSNRLAHRLSEDIYAGRSYFWWSWAERITRCDDPVGAASKVAHVLRAGFEPHPAGLYQI